MYSTCDKLLVLSNVTKMSLNVKYNITKLYIKPKTLLITMSIWCYKGKCLGVHIPKYQIIDFKLSIFFLFNKLTENSNLFTTLPKKESTK